MLCNVRASSSTSCVAGLAVGLAVGFAGAWVMRRAALPSSGLYPLAVMALCFLAYGCGRRGPRVRVRRGVRRRAGPRQRRAAAPRGHPVLRRGPGLAGPDRAVRDARAAALAGPDRPGDHRVRRGGRPGAHPGRATGLGRWSARSSSRCRCASWRSSPGPGCAAPYRSCWRRSRSPRGSATPSELFDIVFVLVVDLHAAHRPDPADGRQGPAGGPALRAPRPRHRGGPARAGRRRPAPGHDQPGLEDARRRGRRAAAAAAAPRSR